MTYTQIITVVGHHSCARAKVARGLARAFGCVRVPSELLTTADGDPIDEAVMLARSSGARQIVLELPTEASVTDAIAAFSDVESGIGLSGVLAVIDAPRFFADLANEDYCPPTAASPTLYVARALRVAQQVEHASAVLVVNWQAVETPDLSVLTAVLSALAPAASLHLHGAPNRAPAAAFAAGIHQPGWIYALNGEHRPALTDSRVQVFVWEHLRPFHPARLNTFLASRFGTGEFGTILRSAGFCRLATRPGVTGGWDQVGQMITLEPLARDDHHGDEEILSLGQSIAVLGVDADADALRAAFDETVLTDAELLEGPGAWEHLSDPLPAWSTANDPADP